MRRHTWPWDWRDAVIVWAAALYSAGWAALYLWTGLNRFEQEEKTMPKRTTAPSTAPVVFGPEYWRLLEYSLKEAKELLWQRLQKGGYKDDVEARAVMDAYWAIKKVVELQAKLHKQLPLPVKQEEELPPARIGLIPQEVASESEAKA